jgi:FixJ family two-component response regulator
MTITNKEWIMLKALLEEGVPKTRIAAQLGLSRKTVARHDPDTEPECVNRFGTTLFGIY